MNKVIYSKVHIETIDFLRWTLPSLCGNKISLTLRLSAFCSRTSSHMRLNMMTFSLNFTKRKWDEILGFMKRCDRLTAKSNRNLGVMQEKGERKILSLPPILLVLNKQKRLAFWDRPQKHWQLLRIFEIC